MKMNLAQALQRAAADLGQEQPPARLHAVLLAALQAHTAHALPAPQPQAPTAATARTTAARAPGAMPAKRAPRTAASARAWSRPWLWSGAAAFATVLVAATVLLLRMPLPAPRVLITGAAAERASGFVPVLPRERWPADTAGGASPAWLVDTELPVERLAALGLPFDPARAGDSVRAEFLVHPSGELLAVRFID